MIISKYIPLISDLFPETFFSKWKKDRIIYMLLQVNLLNFTPLCKWSKRSLSRKNLHEIMSKILSVIMAGSNKVVTLHIPFVKVIISKSFSLSALSPTFSPIRHVYRISHFSHFSHFCHFSHLSHLSHFSHFSHFRHFSSIFTSGQGLNSF